MIYLGHPRDALGLLDVVAAEAHLPTTKALVASKTGRVHAALGDERQARPADARAVSARNLAVAGRRPRTATRHFTDALALRKRGFDLGPRDCPTGRHPSG